MSLASPALTTTSYKKPKAKITKAMQAELERGWRERNVRLKAMGLPKETLEQYTDWVYGRYTKKKEKESIRTKVTTTFSQVSNRQSNGNTSINAVGNSTSSANCVDPTSRSKPWITGPVSSKPSPTYTGSNIIGIGTMHKSNMVPIFSNTEAQDISKMRR